jgi:carbamate kinase
VPDQFDAAVKTMKHIADMIIDGWDVVITHGNGPRLVSFYAGLRSLPTNFTKCRSTTAVPTPRLNRLHVPASLIQ